MLQWLIIFTSGIHIYLKFITTDCVRFYEWYTYIFEVHYNRLCQVLRVVYIYIWSSLQPIVSGFTSGIHIYLKFITTDCVRFYEWYTYIFEVHYNRLCQVLRVVYIYIWSSLQPIVSGFNYTFVNYIVYKEWRGYLITYIYSSTCTSCRRRGLKIVLRSHLD